MTRLPLPLLAALAVLPIPQTAMAQSMDVRAITRTVSEQVCAPFVRSGDLVAARQAAEALGYRATGGDGGVAGAIEMTKPHAGRLVLGLQRADRLCAIAMAEAAVHQIEQAAAPVMQGLNLRRSGGVGEGAQASVIWRGEDVEAVAAPSVRDRPGAVLTFRFTPPHPSGIG